MRQTDVAIVGGGLAGSLAAAMLGRAGIDTLVADPHKVYPPDFRCEKLDPTQVEILERTGLIDAVRRTAAPDRGLWIAGRGRIFDTRPAGQLGIMYDTLVNTLRAEIAGSAALIEAKVVDVATGSERQIVRLSNGEEIGTRLVVLANGLNIGLLHKLGLSRETISANHSVSVGFDVKPQGRPAYEFPGLTYFSERRDERMAYLTLFPTGPAMRANLFGYRDFNDPWLRQVRAEPQRIIYALMPGLRKFMGDFEVTSPVKIRPVDLYVTHGHLQAGIVAVGDAFATSCPAAGTGARKVLTDVERLCNVYIPKWLATPGTGVDKIAMFYDDAVKRECDQASLDKAYSLRSLCIDTSLRSRLEQRARFAVYGMTGAVRRMRQRLTSRRVGNPGAAAATGAGP